MSRAQELLQKTLEASSADASQVNPEASRAYQLLAKTIAADQPQEAPRTQVDFGRGLLQQIAQGLSLGYSDEITSALAAGTAAVKDGADLGTAYDDILSTMRGQQDQFAEDNPKTAIAAQIGGGMLTGGIGAAKSGALQSVNALQKGTKLAAVGATYGAVAGAGYADPNTGLTASESLNERGGGAAVGAVVGGAVGAALPAVAPYVAKGVKGALTTVDDQFRGAPTQALRKLNQAFQRDEVGALTATRNKAVYGADAAILDIGGKNVQGLAEGLATRPGPGLNTISRFLNDRTAGHRDRIISQIKTNVSDKVDDLATLTADIKLRRSTEAGRLYESAYSSGIVDTARLDALREVPAVKTALRAATTKIKNDINLADQFKNVSDENPNIVLWDYAKRALDGKIESLKRAGNGDQVRIYTQLKNEIKDSIAEQNPSYENALASFSHDSAELNAIDLGKTIFKDSAEEIAAKMSKMTQTEQELYRASVGNQLVKILKGVDDTATGLPPNMVKKILGSPAKREAIDAVLGNKAEFRKFSRALNSDRKFMQTRSEIMTGSPTAGRRAQQMDGGVDVGAAADIAGGLQGKLSAITNIGKRMLSGKPSAEFDRELADLLTTTNPTEIKSILMQMESKGSIMPKWAQIVTKMPSDAVQKFMRSSANRGKFAKAMAATVGQSGGSVGNEQVDKYFK